MSLRLRLIVVFFLLSVVPVGAVTYYTYRNNARTIRDAAGFEAEMLAGELSRSMESVTAQLSQRVEQLMAAQAASAATSAQAPTSAPVPPPDAAGQAALAADLEQLENVERILGNYAAMLKNIELRGLGRGGRRGGGPPNAGRGDGPGGERGNGRGPLGAGEPATPPPADQPDAADASQNGRGRIGGNGRGGQNGRGVPEPDDPTRIRIDLAPVRFEYLQKLAQDRETIERMTPEERQALFAQVDQYMQGVQRGIDVLRTELETRAVAINEVWTQGASESVAALLASSQAAAASASQTTAGREATPADPAPQPRPAQPAAPPPAAPTPPTPPTTPVMLRSTELSGGRLAVRLERDGELVGEVDADIDLDMLLRTVFETTASQRGEVPFAVGGEGTLYTRTEEDKAQIEALQTDAVRPGTPPGTTILPDWIVVTTPDPTGSELTFGIARPFGDALNDLERVAARNAGLGLAFIGLALVAIVPLSGRLTHNLDRLSDGVNRIAQGDYAARVKVKSQDEIGRLAQAFNLMAVDVEAHHRSAVEQERIRRELELGRQIQNDMLPSEPLRLGLTEVKGVSVPAREVGGDFFNYFQLHDGTIALLVGDVSGKGVGAALLMANIQAALRTRLSLGQDLASLAQELDLEIDRTTPGPVYATLFVGILDPATRRLRCVNAGHNPQYVLRTDGRIERMESTGRPIGLYSGGGYAEQRFDLAAGDIVFFYTDGCVEAENAAGDMFGSERLEQVLRSSAGRAADDVLVKVEAEVTRFRAGIELQDDATMMVVRVG